MSNPHDEYLLRPDPHNPRLTERVKGVDQTGQAIEVIFITMLVYLAISLATSLFMNWFNRHIALVER